jgi:hypothetical protein
MWDKVKSAFMWIGAALTAILGIFLLFRNSEDKAKTELLVNDAKLEGKQEDVQSQIDADKAKLEKLEKEGVKDLPPDEVEEYWKKNLGK